MNDLLTGSIALVGLVSLVALGVSLRAHRDAQGAKQQPAQVRELVREMEDVLEQMSARQARESMRAMREIRRQQQQAVEPVEGDAPAESAPPIEDSKAALWALVRQRGISH